MLQVQDPGKWITRQPFSVFHQLLGKLVRCRCSQHFTAAVAATTFLESMKRKQNYSCGWSFEHARSRVTTSGQLRLVPWSTMYHSIFQHRLGVSDLRHHLEATTAYSRPGLSSRACGKLGDSKKLPILGVFWMIRWSYDWRYDEDCVVCVCTKLSWHPCNKLRVSSLQDMSRHCTWSQSPMASSRFPRHRWAWCEMSLGATSGYIQGTFCNILYIYIHVYWYWYIYIYILIYPWQMSCDMMRYNCYNIYYIYMLPPPQDLHFLY